MNSIWIYIQILTEYIMQKQCFVLLIYVLPILLMVLLT